MSGEVGVKTKKGLREKKKKGRWERADFAGSKRIWARKWKKGSRWKAKNKREREVETAREERERMESGKAESGFYFYGTSWCGSRCESLI